MSLFARVAHVDNFLGVRVWHRDHESLNWLFRTQISSWMHAFYSRQFVNDQFMTLTFNLEGVRDMGLTNTRR
jgi:hypothetical protein